MPLEPILNISLLADDVKYIYTMLRKKGASRTEVLEKIKKDYANELADSDDRIGVLIGLVKALCLKNELFQEIAEDTHREIQNICAQSSLNRSVRAYCNKVEALIQDKKRYGGEAVYHQRKPFVPTWKDGDLFAHTIKNPAAERFGTLGMTILFHIIDHYISFDGLHNHLVLVAMCQAGKEPKTADDLRSISYVANAFHKNSTEYIWQIAPRSKREEATFEFTKIGNYPIAYIPEDTATVDPRTVMPFWGRIRKEEYPDYETHISDWYVCTQNRSRTL